MVIGSIETACSVVYGAPPSDAGTWSSSEPEDASSRTPDASSRKPGAGGPRGCYEEDLALALQGTAPIRGAAMCTAPQIGEIERRCLNPMGTQGECDAYLPTNKACSRCVFGARSGDDPETTPIGALIPRSEVSVAPNTAACAALVLGKPECAVKAAAQAVCLSSACPSCATDATASAECQRTAAAGICRGTVDLACDQAIRDRENERKATCVGATFTESYTKVATYLRAPAVRRWGQRRQRLSNRARGAGG